MVPANARNAQVNPVAVGGAVPGAPRHTTRSASGVYAVLSQRALAKDKRPPPLPPAAEKASAARAPSASRHAPEDDDGENTGARALVASLPSEGPFEGVVSVPTAHLVLGQTRGSFIYLF